MDFIHYKDQSAIDVSKLRLTKRDMYNSENVFYIRFYFANEYDSWKFSDKKEFEKAYENVLRYLNSKDMFNIVLL